ncbi:MAG: hypothetical protein MZU84_02475 [Sphingobacterium sp.]|nr:hypothetical protein [Sphingobacterium sp.]
MKSPDPALTISLMEESGYGDNRTPGIVQAESAEEALISRDPALIFVSI